MKTQGITPYLAFGALHTELFNTTLNATVLIQRMFINVHLFKSTITYSMSCICNETREHISYSFITNVKTFYHNTISQFTPS